MSNSPLANSKSALAFAAVTIVGALMFVGNQNGGGALGPVTGGRAQEGAELVEEARIDTPQRAEMIEPLDPAAGWGGTAEPVFGDYNAEEVPPAEREEEQGGAARWTSSSRRPTAPQGSIGGVVKPDRPGVLVPRPDGMGEDASPRGEPVVTSRTMTIEP